jgi:hypothetical protein
MISGANVTGGLRQSLTGYVTVPAGSTQCLIALFNYQPSVTTALVYDQVIVQHASGGVRNSDGNVLIDGGGVTVTNGKITVSNAGSVVVIDGTSKMFRIVRSGSISATASAGATGTTTVTLTSYGAVSAPLTHSSYVYRSNAIGSNDRRITPDIVAMPNYFVAATSGGAVTTRVIAMQTLTDLTTQMDGSNLCVVSMAVYNAFVASYTAYGAYYVFAEASL